jgi:hypothetical protein
VADHAGHRRKLEGRESELSLAIAAAQGCYDESDAGQWKEERDQPESISGPLNLLQCEER